MMFRFKAGNNCISLYKKSYSFRKKGIIGKLLSEFLRRRIILRYGCYISPKSEIDFSVVFPHPVGIIIGEGVKVGSDSIIYQGVTLGAARRGENSLASYPTIGKNVTIFSGAVIVGNISIGDNVVVGANAVVTKNVENGATVVGVPAKSVG